MEPQLSSNRCLRSRLTGEGKWTGALNKGYCSGVCLRTPSGRLSLFIVADIFRPSPHFGPNIFSVSNRVRSKKFFLFRAECRSDRTYYLKVTRMMNARMKRSNSTESFCGSDIIGSRLTRKNRADLWTIGEPSLVSRSSVIGTYGTETSSWNERLGSRPADSRLHN